MATATRPSTETVWRWLAEVPDPEIPVISLVDLGIIRDVAWEDETLVVTVTPTYSGCPATTVINLDIERALNENGIDKVRLQAPAFAGLDHRLDQRRRPRKAQSLRHCAAGRRHGRRRRADEADRPPLRPLKPDDRLSALRLDTNRKDQPVRIDALQGQLSLHRLPGTLRLFQVHLTDKDRPSVARFHSLQVTEVRRETRDAVVVTLVPREEDRAAFDFTQGQYLTFRRKFDGEELRRSYSICAGRDEGVLRSASSGSMAAASPPGRTRN